TLETGIAVDAQGRVTVDITAKIGGSLIEDLAAAGADLSYIYPQYNSLRATVALDQLERIAGFPQVIFIMPKQEGQVWRAAEPAPSGFATASLSGIAPDFAERASRVRTRLTEALATIGQRQQEPNVGSQNSQGDTTHKANTARSTYGANGAGVKIGVISNGCPSLAASQALGDLGPVTVLPGQVGSGDEGTAMLEIVHDLAPGAQLFFATANPMISVFAQNIRDLRTAGCDIIVDDVFYFVETPFQDGQAPSVVSNTNGGLVTQAVKDVTAAGALYFSSAGNQGNLTDSTSSCYQGDFVSGGTLALVPGGNLHDFDSGGGVQQFDLIQTGSGNPINLYWSDPLGGSANDYDLFVLNSTSTSILASSTNVQNGTQDPFEQTSGTTNVTNNRVVVLQKTGAANRFFHITINANGAGRLGTATEGTTKGHSMALDAYSCAATPASGPFPGPFTAANVSETFSSDGPRRIFFLENGTAITPGNFSSTGGTLRQKPDITAADGVSVTGVGGFPTTFFGTSAAAPHAAAIAGLLKSAFPTLTPAQIRTRLTGSAIDIETAGVDRTTGAGIVMAFESLQAEGAVASANFETGTITATETCCNANTFIEPGEQASLSVQLMNTGVANATGISATLSTITPNVNISTAVSAYPNIATSASGTNTTPFAFSLTAAAPCDLKVNFILTIAYTGGNSPKVAKFSVQTGRAPVSVTTTIDAVAPPASTDYTAVTGTQTNRLFRDGRASTCNVSKAACPGVSAATSPRFDAYTFSSCSTGAATKCITVTLTTPCPTVGGGTQLFATAYTGSFVPGNVCTNYLADAGVSPGANTVFNGFTFTIAANATFVVVVAEVPGTATNCTYTLTVSGLCLACPTAAKVDNFNATGFDDGRVLLQWQSAEEVDNLGFNVYREQDGQRVKVNSQIVAGSSLTTGAGNSLLTGHSYQWGDAPLALSKKTRYWLEEVDLNGASSWIGPVEVRRSRAKRSAAQERSAALLSSLGMSNATIAGGAGSAPSQQAASLASLTPETALTQSNLASQAAVKIGV
ncbi:MAG TPA: S8 family serine peptidase, partial [Blastocatellia bacterium]|nr:S8 family serine peptidase [Blastocatellia bacterium]